MKKRICPACNKGSIVDLKKPGRRTPYRNIPDLEIPAELAIPTCDHCGEEWVDAATSARLDDALKEAYQSVLPAKVENALRQLTEAGVTQQELERLLGLSVGYLSKLKSGKETSTQLIGMLMMLAAEPSVRVDELRELWRTTTSSPQVVETKVTEQGSSMRMVITDVLPSIPAKNVSLSGHDYPRGQRQTTENVVEASGRFGRRSAS